MDLARKAPSDLPGIGKDTRSRLGKRRTSRAVCGALGGHADDGRGRGFVRIGGHVACLALVYYARNLSVKLTIALSRKLGLISAPGRGSDAAGCGLAQNARHVRVRPALCR
jgi:hypothetical protein